MSHAQKVHRDCFPVFNFQISDAVLSRLLLLSHAQKVHQEIPCVFNFEISDASSLEVAPVESTDVLSFQLVGLPLDIIEVGLDCPSPGQTMVCNLVHSGQVSELDVAKLSLNFVFLEDVWDVLKIVASF